MRGDQPVTSVGTSTERTKNNVAEPTDGLTETEDQPAKERKELNFWLPVHVAAREHREALAEVAGLIADGMDTNEAAELVGIDIQGEKLPTLAPYVPSPATIAAACLDAQTAWSTNERRKRNMRPAERWELSEASAAPIESERRAYCGLLG